MKAAIRNMICKFMCLVLFLLLQASQSLAEPVIVVLGEDLTLESGNTGEMHTSTAPGVPPPKVLLPYTNGKQASAQVVADPGQGGGASATIGLETSIQPAQSGKLSQEAEFTVTVEYHLRADTASEWGSGGALFEVIYDSTPIEEDRIEVHSQPSTKPSHAESINLNKEIKFKKMLSTTGDNTFQFLNINAWGSGSLDALASATVKQIKISFNLNPYYWRGIERPNIETKYYEENNPPVLLLRDFECKTHDYGEMRCSSPNRGMLPNITFGASLPESNSNYVTTNLFVKIAGVEICKNKETWESYAECSSEIGDRMSSLNNLSQVMEAVEKYDPNEMMDFAYGEAILDFSYEGKPQTKIFQFKAKIPRFEGLYIFQKNANGYWDWEKYTGDLGGISFAYLLIHGWQTERYPNFMWLYDLALDMKTQYPQLPVLGWFWQKEAYDPGITIIPGVPKASLIGALNVSFQVSPQAEILKRTLINQDLNPAAKVHFIGHSFGGFMACLAARNLLQYRQNNQNIFDGVNFKVTILDTYQPIPGRIMLKDAIKLLLSRGGEIENIITQLGDKFSDLIPVSSIPNTNLDITIANQELCGDHGAAAWHFFDGQLWKKPWLERKTFPWPLPNRNQAPIYYLLGQ
jgi:hypothetical protein